MTKKILLSTLEQEIDWVCKEVRSLIQNGTKPEEIAIIGRTNKTLNKFYDYFIKNQIAVNFKQSGNILELPIIQQILTICEFINSLLVNNQKAADELLPEILSYDFWQIKDAKIWEISLISHQKRQTWLQTMLEDEELNQIAGFLIKLGIEAKTEPGDFVVHAILGNAEVQLDSNFLQTDQDPSYTSPLKKFYFDSAKISQDYLKNLSAIQTLYSAIENHFGSQKFNLKDLVNFTRLLKDNHISLLDKSDYQFSEKAINIMTAHTSKGLEFEKVFVINCTKSEWQKRGKASKIQLPKYLNLAPEKEESDDFIRLFYVAVTRAKDDLWLTAHQSANSKDLELFEFVPHDFEFVESDMQDSQEALSTILEPKVVSLTELSKLDLLQSKLKDYHLSYSDLITFLDVVSGGTQVFLENQLLSFPAPQSIFQIYGNSVHNALKALFLEWKQTKILPDSQSFLALFEKYLQRERSKPEDYTKLINKGKIELPVFYQTYSKSWKLDSLVEYSFFEQNIVLQNARLSGRTDRIDFDDENGEIVVVDYKTAKPITWEAKDPSKKIKLWKYQTQLAFYAVLVRHSSFKSKYPNYVGQIEFVGTNLAGESVVLNKKISPQEIDFLQDLIEKVYQKIVTLDFPDISGYPQTLKGIQDFCEDLVAGKV
jgi:DNA helicase-2/ATP-dependent DNA helicase PcrA